MPKRTQIQVSIQELVKAICRIDCSGPVSELATLPAATISGRLDVAPIDKVCQATDNKFTSHWIELRGDVLTFIKSDAAKSGKAPKPKQVAFCSIVDPPSSAICTSPELRALSEKLIAKQFLAVYTPDGNGIWLDISGDAAELARWLHVRANASPPSLHSFLPLPCAFASRSPSLGGRTADKWYSAGRGARLHVHIMLAVYAGDEDHRLEARRRLIMVI